MDKIRQSSKNITPFGGLNFIYSAINRSKIDSFIDQKLGYRNFRAHYSYSDIVLSLLGNSFCNGEYASDLEHLKNKYSHQYFTKIPSPDIALCTKTGQLKVTEKHTMDFDNVVLENETRGL